MQGDLSLYWMHMCVLLCSGSLGCWLAMIYLPRRNSLDHVFVKVYYFANILQHVSYLAIGPLPSKKNGKRKVQGVPQSQTAALPRHQEEEETDKSKQAQIDQTYEKH